MSVETFSFFIPDTSSVINYYPTANGDPNTASGWTTWFSISGHWTTPGMFGAGKSFHTSTTVGSGFSLSFHGTSLLIEGSANCSYVTSLDGATSSSTPLSDGFLFAAESLTDTLHSFNLTLTKVDRVQTQLLSFNGANITFSGPSNSLPQGLRIDNSNTATVTYGPPSASWTSGSVPHVPSDTEAPYKSTDSESSYAEIQFQGSAVAVTGFATTGHGGYTVTIDGKERGTLEGTSDWLIGDRILYFESGLGTSPHKFRITNAPDGWGSTLSLNSFIVWGSGSDSIASNNASTPVSNTSTSPTSPTPPPTSPTSPPTSPTSSTPLTSSSTPLTSPPSSPTQTVRVSSKVSHSAAIVGGIVGSLTLIVLALVVVFIWKRRIYPSKARFLTIALAKNSTTDTPVEIPCSRKSPQAPPPPMVSQTEGTPLMPQSQICSRAEQIEPLIYGRTDTRDERQHEHQVAERVFTMLVDRFNRHNPPQGGHFSAPPPAYETQSTDP